MRDLVDWTKYCDTEIDGIAVFDGFHEVVFSGDGVEPDYWSVFLTLKPTPRSGGREVFGDYLTLDQALKAAIRCDAEIESATGRRVDGFH